MPTDQPETEAEIEARLAELLPRAAAPDARHAIVSLLLAAWQRYPERCASDWIPRAEPALHAHPPGYRFTAEHLTRYALAGAPHPPLRLFSTLAVQNSWLRPDAVTALLAHPDMRNVEALSLISCELCDEGLAALAAAIAPGQLRVLDVQDNRLGDEGLCALLEAGKLERLTHLGLFRNHIGERGMRALMASAGLPRLQMLSVGFQNSIPASALCDAIAAAPALGRVRELRLEHSDITDDDAVVLAGAAGLAGLGALFLSGNPISPRGLLALRESPHLQQTEIDL